ncbi:KAP family P-loop NTPase fold protein [Pseudomonas lutea]|uniref:KAP NTPase domain-containing protein n=1 Tax=Pseudomonas lutea TaxID=243924 RepID=A0A9X0JGT3_9PSED|nr:P-loop NTPase fold protein [Pseudomonas lutea]KGF62071.1 hypothetical protein LT42_25225 [Pseudomonas lutea]
MEHLEQQTPWAKDCMDRQRVAKFLTRHLDQSPHIKVLNINSEWGSGKTFFVTEWQREAKENRVCVYFDAWKHDYTGDPFVSLVATIKDQLTDQIGRSAKTKKTLAAFTKSAAKTLLAATPVIVKGLVKKATAIDAEDLAIATEGLEDLPSDAAEKAIEKLIDSKKEALKSVEDFKKVLLDLLAEAAKNKNSDPIPAYIFIDELDRCRPTFAIELLERIKHLFDIPLCKFIIASDTTQLAHSITAIYGNGFESHKYLKRFFDAEFELDNTNMENWVKTVFAGNYRDSWTAIALPLASSDNDRHAFPSEKRVNPDQNTIAHNKTNKLNARQVVILAMLYTFDPQLRELEKLVSQIQAFEENCAKDSFQFFWAAYLLFLKDADRNLYRAFLKGDEAAKSVEGKFPSMNLHFGDSNSSIHTIAGWYLRCHRSTRQEVRNFLSREQGASFISEILNNFYNHYAQIKLYPALVDLAHRLD